jgi:phage gp36-like protein
MSFLTKDDFSSAIRSNVLDDIINFEDSRINVAVDDAVDLMAGYLSARYDVALIFAHTGTGRNKTIVRICKDIALYDLHSNINPRKIPKLRYDRYADAIEWLEKVRAQEINPIGLEVPVDNTKSYIKFGGNTKRRNQW